MEKNEDTQRKQQESLGLGDDLQVERLGINMEFPRKIPGKEFDGVLGSDYFSARNRSAKRSTRHYFSVPFCF